MVEDFKKIGKKRLGGILMSEGLVTPEQVTEALEIQKDTGKMLGQVLIELGYVTEYDLAKSLATQFQFPYINPNNYAINRDALENIPAEMMYKHVFVPLDKFGNMLIVAMAGLLSEAMLQEIRKLTSCDVRIYVATARDVKSVLQKEVPIDSKLRKQIEGPSIAPVVAKVKKRAAAKKVGKKVVAEEAAPTKPAPAGIDILDQAEAAVSASAKKAAPVDAEGAGVGVGSVEAPGGDVNWQNLFNEVDKSIRDEVEQRKEKKDSTGEEEVDYDFDYD